MTQLAQFSSFTDDLKERFSSRALAGSAILEIQIQREYD